MPWSRAIPTKKLPSVGWFGCIRKLSVWSIAVPFAAERGGRCGWFPVFPSGRNFHRPPATALISSDFSPAAAVVITTATPPGRGGRCLIDGVVGNIGDFSCCPSACYWSVKRMEMVNRWRGQDTQWAVIGWKSDNQHFGYVTPFSGENFPHVRVNISFGRFQFWSRMTSWVHSPAEPALGSC